MQEEEVVKKAEQQDSSSGDVGGNLSASDEKKFLTTQEAADYLRKSASWLLRQPGIPYVKGRPNLYQRSDLDRWFERKKFRSRVV